MGIESKGDSQHLGGSAPLPDTIDSTDELARFVEWFVSKKEGYKIWKLPDNVDGTSPFELPDGRLVVGPGALMWRWHFTIMGKIFERWPSHFRPIERLQTMKNAPQIGVMVMLRPLKMIDVLNFFSDLKLITRGARA